MLSTVPYEPSVPLAPDVGDAPAVAALVERAIQQDQQAFAGLYDLYLERVYRYVFFRVGRREEAEDVTETVFLRAWQAVPRYRQQGRPFIAWLVRLAHNACVDYHRARRPVDSLTDDERPLDVEDGKAAAAFDQCIAAEVLARSVTSLTPEQQQLSGLKFGDGRDNAEIATLLGKPEGAVRAQQMRALRSLRRVLEQQGMNSAHD
jgi:RNA polymerase sigma-70 factor, ECF subfamily